MIYGFKKLAFGKEQLDKMSEDARVALAKLESKKGIAFVYDGTNEEDEHFTRMDDLYYLYEDKRTEKHDNNVPKVYAVVYSAYDPDPDAGLYTETHVFSTLEKAIEDKDRYIQAEIADDWSVFGGLASMCKSSDEFFEQYAKEITERSLHLYDASSDQSLNIDIYEQIVR